MNDEKKAKIKEKFNSAAFDSFSELDEWLSEGEPMSYDQVMTLLEIIVGEEDGT